VFKFFLDKEYKREKIDLEKIGSARLAMSPMLAEESQFGKTANSPLFPFILPVFVVAWFSRKKAVFNNEVLLDYKYDVIQLKNYNNILGMNSNAYALRENEFD
jgi:hypothetical protein